MTIKSNLIKLLKLKAKVLGILALAGLGFYVAANAPMWHLRYIENSVGKVVVKVVKDGTAVSGGTGFHVKAKSGRTYILTNAHVCRVSEDGINALVQLPQSDRSINRKIIEVYSKHDLCLIEGIPGYEGISVVDDVKMGTDARAVGHPLLRPMRAALGTLIQETTIQVVTGMIGSAEEEKQCLDRKGKIAMAFIFMVCVQDIVSIETNIVIFGGSSGSPVVDFFGRLVGVVFAGDNRTNYGYLVPIRYITDFLSAY